MGYKSVVFSMFNHQVVWNFEVYCGKSPVANNLPPPSRGEPQLAHKVVLD